MLYEVITTHGTTYGGNPLACAVSGAVIDLIAQPELLEGVKQKSALFVSELEAINQRHGVFSEIRGRGLLLGAELAEPWKGIV